jgi:hypothetical protein
MNPIAVSNHVRKRPSAERGHAAAEGGFVNGSAKARKGADLVATGGAGAAFGAASSARLSFWVVAGAFDFIGQNHLQLNDRSPDHSL